MKLAKTHRRENWHTKTMERFATLSIYQLTFIRDDAYKAALAGEEIENPKTGQYWDEMFYADMELTKRFALYNK